MTTIRMLSILAALMISSFAWAQDRPSTEQAQTMQSAKDVGGVSDISETRAGSISGLEPRMSNPDSANRYVERSRNDTFRHH
ncbi:hypothetical protein AWB67_05855 [Caballeronia terrestris]|uniref:Lipoprotein n=1 Tax=Caballeronia terrestris TaxID=1226301 RepID=A0A158KK32_9BURK|nr:hypothetical protein AWB67_05855 [Caballeronia terrestris]